MKKTLILTTLTFVTILGLSACGGGGGGGNTDTDNDGINNDVDNCPNDANPGQEDADGDGTGDACDAVNDNDTDGDGINNDVDNCPINANPGQEDSDGDGVGDACDTALNTFDGVWQGSCQETSSAVSFRQELTIDGATTSSDIDVFTQPNCPSGISSTSATALGTFDYKGATPVSAVCASGNAEKVDATITSLSLANGAPITDPASIAALLSTLGVSVVPEFNLLCLDANGGLRTGDVSGTNNGSSDALRPTSMGNDIFTKTN